MRGDRGEVLWKPEKKKWWVRLVEEKSKGRLYDDSGFWVFKNGWHIDTDDGDRTVENSSDRWSEKASSKDDLPGSESSSTSEKLCDFEQVP